MGTTKITKGLDIPIAGEPEQSIREGRNVHRVALIGPDYIGMKPGMKIAVGDEVKTGQALFFDKKMPLVKYTSPGAGKVVAIHRGEKRVFLSMVIQLDGDGEITFENHRVADLAGLSREAVVKLLLESGQWPLLRQRPFSKIANPEETPRSIFVTAMDSEPLAPKISKLLEGKEELFQFGLQVLGRLTDGKIYVCKYPDENIPVGNAARVVTENFSGPHPAGLVGTHMHFLDPVGRNHINWYINAQDVAAIGYLFTTGKIFLERIVSFAGPAVQKPGLIKTRVGASLFDLTKGALTDGENRVISGSVLSGRTATQEMGYLGRFHHIVSALQEGKKKEFLGWLAPGFDKYSSKFLVASKLLGRKKFAFDTALNGGRRAIVPVGNYEKVMPLDIIPTYLLRSLAVKDIEEAEKLGALELGEEDLSLCTFVCQSKLDYGPMLRENLTIIEKEG